MPPMDAPNATSKYDHSEKRNHSAEESESVPQASNPTDLDDGSALDNANPQTTVFSLSSVPEATFDWGELIGLVGDHQRLKDQWHKMRVTFLDAVEKRFKCVNCGEFHGYETDQSVKLWETLWKEIKESGFGLEVVPKAGDEGDRGVTMEKVQGWLDRMEEIEKLYEEESGGTACGQWTPGFVEGDKKLAERSSEQDVRARGGNRDWIKGRPGFTGRDTSGQDASTGQGASGWHDVGGGRGRRADRGGEGRKANICFNCGQEGHRKQDCTNERVIKCRNCDEFGHVSKECSQPKDWSRVKCNVCGEMGHTKAQCPAEKANAESATFSYSGGDNFDSGGGGNGAGQENWASGNGGGNWDTGNAGGNEPSSQW